MVIGKYIQVSAIANQIGCDMDTKLMTPPSVHSRAVTNSQIFDADIVNLLTIHPDKNAPIQCTNTIKANFLVSMYSALGINLFTIISIPITNKPPAIMAMINTMKFLMEELMTLMIYNANIILVFISYKFSY
jgi:hypothetical protein